MGIPSYDTFYRDFLDALSDGQIRKLSDIRRMIAEKKQFTQEELSELLPSGRQTVFFNRANWAGVYLYKAGLLVRPSRGNYALSEEGKIVQQNSSIVLDNSYLMRYPSFAEFQNASVVNTPTPVQTNITETPADTIETAFQKINAALADDLMQEIMNQDAAFFEKLVVKLLLAMGYGGPFEDAGRVTQSTGDGGIDGIIREDKLGFNQIYIQAKRWDCNSTVSRPELQKFAGALLGEGASKGLFITTSKFSKAAEDFAKRQHIVLVDGNTLTRLMIEYNIGVSVSKSYSIKRLDTDFFNDDSI
ncbi:MAG: restriction endonuclease [Clostridiales bacterium]|nr:restriction endonuclease [Clostridiales bacterium]